MDPKKILLAIDKHESSMRAVDYVGKLTKSCPGFRITIIHVIEKPSEDYFENEPQRMAYLESSTKEAQDLLGRARQMLLDHGLQPEAITFEAPVKTCDSMASCIVEEAKDDYGTLVVGRRGISKSEEFLFGSVSKKIIDQSKKCTVWIVE
jgi:nucleotide-binding universal stress UspA family protein